MSLLLTLSVRDELVAHARATAPDEAIGVVVTDGFGDRVIPLTNVAPAGTRRSRYEADPTQWLQVSQEMEDRGEDVRIVYHSHPQTEAVPSPYDIAHATYPGAAYVIVSLAGPEPTLRAWRILEGGTASEVRVITFR